MVSISNFNQSNFNHILDMEGLLDLPSLVVGATVAGQYLLAIDKAQLTLVGQHGKNLAHSGMRQTPYANVMMRC